MDSASTSISSPQYSWSALPTDLLSKIANTLDTRIDVLRFRAVCRSWRSLIPLPSMTPQSIRLPYPIVNSNCGGHFILKEFCVYALEPLATIPRNETKTWVIKIQESPESGKVILIDPLCPSFEKFEVYLPEGLNLLDYKAFEISKSHDLEFVKKEENHFDFNVVWPICVNQVAISSRIDKVYDNLAVMVLHGDGKLAVWRIGNGEWTNIDDDWTPYSYIQFYDRKFFAVDYDGFTLIVDAVSFEVSRIGPQRIFDFGLSSKCMVKSLGDLFLVGKQYTDICDSHLLSNYHDKEDLFLLKIYKLNEEKTDWVEVDGIKDLAFFVGFHESFSVNARDFGGIKRNCVYFAYYQIGGGYSCFDAGIYGLEDDSVRTLSKFPGYSKIFWPPPTWLRKDAEQ